jgi:phosphomannomutase
MPKKEAKQFEMIGIFHKFSLKMINFTQDVNFFRLRMSGYTGSNGKINDKGLIMLKVTVSGIRGIWGESLTHEKITGYLKAFVQILGKKRKVALGRDTRKSGEVIHKLVLSVLESYGYEVMDLGIVPTPLVLFAVRDKELDGGIVISASHNPAEWNALKLVKAGGFFLNESEVETLKKNYDRKDFPDFSYGEQGNTVPYAHILRDYISQAQKFIDFHLIRKKKLRVVADVVNGTAYQFAHALLYDLDAEHKTIFDDITKEFERGAEPLPENLTALKEEVIKFGADAGLAYDPDADRLALVDERGEPMGEDWTLAIAYLNLLEKGEVKDMAVNLSTSSVMNEIASQFGARVYKAKVGEINVTEKMLEKNLVMGGEGNGGVIYRRINNCRDSLIATFLVLEYIARTGKKLSEIKGEYPILYPVKERIPVQAEIPFDAIREKIAGFLKRNNISVQDVNREDGLRVDYTGGWIQV